MQVVFSAWLQKDRDHFHLQIIFNEGLYQNACTESFSLLAAVFHGSGTVPLHSTGYFYVICERSAYRRGKGTSLNVLGYSWTIGK